MKNCAQPIPRVVLLVESSRQSGRALLCGVARYAQHHGPWSFFWEPRGLEKGATPMRWQEADGVIMRDTDRVEEVLAADPKVPGMTLSNTLAQQLARKLQISGKDYF